MVSQEKRAWADLSSELSSLSDGSRPGRQSVLAGLPAPSMNPDTLGGALAIEQTGQDITWTEPSAIINANEANARFYQKSAKFEPSTKQSGTAGAFSISGKRKRPLGPVDLSAATHTSGLADIHLPEPAWRGRQPPGIRIPPQLVDFGKYNMRYEAHRDLGSEDTFDRELADGEQSWVANHYVDHLAMAEKYASDSDDGNGSSLYPVRPPSPPLPADVVENLQVRTWGMVEALMHAKAERDGLLTRETELMLEEKALTEWRKALDEQTRTLTREIDRLREECAENDVDAGQIGLFSTDGGRAVVLDGEVRPLAGGAEASISNWTDAVLSHERESSTTYSEMSGIGHSLVASAQRPAQS